MASLSDPRPSLAASRPAVSPLARRLAAQDTLSAEDLAALDGLAHERRRIPAHTEITLGRQDAPKVLALHEGWAFRYKLLPDGRRQIVTFHVPGDLIGLFVMADPQGVYSVKSVTPVEIGVIEPRRLSELFVQAPRVAQALTGAALADGERMVGHVISLGRLTAYERVAHLLLDLAERLRQVGLAGDRQFQMPLTQLELADHLGLSTVHVNRTLQQLRRDGLVDLDRRQAILVDPARLRAAAGLR